MLRTVTYSADKPAVQRGLDGDGWFPLHAVPARGLEDWGLESSEGWYFHTSGGR